MHSYPGVWWCIESPHCCTCEINAQCCYQCPCWSQHKLGFILVRSTLQSLPTQMEYAIFLPFVCKRAAVKLCYFYQALTKNLRCLSDDSAIPSSSAFSPSKIRLPKMIASQCRILSNYFYFWPWNNRNLMQWFLETNKYHVLWKCAMKGWFL